MSAPSTKQRAVTMKRNGMDDSLVGAILGVSADDVRALVYDLSPSVDLSTALVATLTLDNEQIKALATTSVEIIPAPGPGKVIFVPAIEYVGGAMLRYRWRGDYDNIDDFCLLELKYNALPIPEGEDAPTPRCRWDELRPMLMWGVDADLVIFPGPNDTNNSAADVAVVENKSVAVWLNNNDAGDLTDGHEDNELQISLSYSIVDLV